MIRNLKNNMWYVGSSNDISRRFKEHKCDTNIDKFHNALRCHGAENFEVEAIEECPDDAETLRSREQAYLDIAFRTPEYIYNTNPLADRPPNWKGRKRGPQSKEHIAKLSKKRKGRKLPRNEEWNKKIGEAQRSKVLHTFVNKKTGEIVTETMHNFCEKYGLEKSNVCNVLKGNRNIVGGWCIPSNVNFTRKPHSAEARLKIGKAIQGSKHPRYDSTVYSFIKNTGESFIGTQHELRTVYGLNCGNVCQMVRGNPKVRSVKGWKLA